MSTALLMQVPQTLSEVLHVISKSDLRVGISVPKYTAPRRRNIELISIILKDKGKAILKR